MLRLGGARTLDGTDAAAVRRVLDLDPVESVFVASRVEDAGLGRRSLGGQLWGYGGARIESVCLSGSNLVPVNAGANAVRAFADRAAAQGRRCSSIVGRAESVHRLWDLLEPEWGAARLVRQRQPVMSVAADAALPLRADTRVRPVSLDELDVLFPAAVAMFTEEIGVSPLQHDGGQAYRTRVAELVRRGRSFARIEDGRVVFKAELGAVSQDVAQIQGVWVDPELRGHGLAAAATTSVVEAARRTGARIVSLYVNDFNEPARRAYRRVGFRETGAFASVLF